MILRDRLYDWLIDSHPRALDALQNLRRRALELLGSDSRSRTSLHQIEAKLDEIFGGEPGYFVEAGAFDGVTQSNTYWLERFRGWRGLLVEAIPEQAENARRMRPGSTVISCALVAPSDAGRPVTVRYAGLLSLVDGARGNREQDNQWVSRGLVLQRQVAASYTTSVPGRTLSDVLDAVEAPPAIDLLSLDVEGFERQVLKGLDFGRHRPRYILVEVNDREGTDRLLRKNGYDAVDMYFTPTDALYRDTSSPNSWSHESVS